MATASKKIARENVVALLEARTGPLRPNESGVTRLKELGFANGTAQRVLDDASDIYLETVDRLASAFKLRPWQLLVPDLEPANLPLLAGEAELSDRAIEVARWFDAMDSDKREHLHALWNTVRGMVIAGMPINITIAPHEAADSGGVPAPKPKRGPDR